MRSEILVRGLREKEPHAGEKMGVKRKVKTEKRQIQTKTSLTEMARKERVEGGRWEIFQCQVSRKELQRLMEVYSNMGANKNKRNTGKMILAPEKNN